MEQENNDKVIKEVITEKTYVYEDGTCNTIAYIQRDSDKKAITNYREQNLLQERYKSKSVFLKMFTGGNKRPIIPQFKPNSFAQHYLNTLPMIKPEENTLGEFNEEGKWHSYSKEEYKQALGLNTTTFDRYFDSCLNMNLLSVYGRNNDMAIYVNPYYLFNGKQLHLSLCLAFDHDNRFINSLTEKAREEYFVKKSQIEDFGEIILS